MNPTRLISMMSTITPIEMLMERAFTITPCNHYSEIAAPLIQYRGLEYYNEISFTEMERDPIEDCHLR